MSIFFFFSAGPPAFSFFSTKEERRRRFWERGRSVFSRGAMFADLTLILFCFWWAPTGFSVSNQRKQKMWEKMMHLPTVGNKESTTRHPGLIPNRSRDRHAIEQGGVHTSLSLSPLSFPSPSLFYSLPCICLTYIVVLFKVRLSFFYSFLICYY